MNKSHTILILLVFTLSTHASEITNNVYDELQLIQSFKDENIITQQQYFELQNRIQAKTTKPLSNTILGTGTATISGHIQNDSAIALATYQVTLYEIVSGQQQYRETVNTDAMGNYSFIDLLAGTYVVHSGSYYDDYLNYLWNPTSLILCTDYSCEVPVSSHISLADAAVVNNIDFTTVLGGSISGNISDALTMLSVNTLNASIVKNNSDYSYNLFSQLDSITGNFSIKGIPDGDYRIYLQSTGDNNNPNMHIPQIHGGPECNACGSLLNQGIGATITINMANAINNIDFSVNVGASISGNLVDNDTLNPLQELGLVMLFNELNRNLAYIVLYGINHEPLADGSYTVGGLLPGSYYVQGGDLGREFYQRELYNNRPCYYAGCDRSSTGDPILLGANQNLTGINFLLNKGGKISGTVTDTSTGLPITLDPTKNSWVEFYDASETVIGSAFIGEDGTYTSQRAIPTGSYAVRTGSMFQGSMTSPYVNEKYNDIACAGLACDLSTEDVVVALETTTANIDFALTTGNTFTGTVTDLSTAAPIAGVHVIVYKEISPGVVKFANWATTSDGTIPGGAAIGTFEVSGLPDGTYYARTGYGSDLPFFVSSFHNIGGAAPVGWIDILYDNMPCLADCDVTLGTAIEFSPIVANKNTEGAPIAPVINFGLTQGSVITGQVTDFIQNAPIKDVTVNVYNNQGTFMGSSITNDTGEYITRGLPDGSYYLTTTSDEVLLDVKYGNEFCVQGNCNPLEAQPITVSGTNTSTNKDFILKTAYMHMFSNDFE